MSDENIRLEYWQCANCNSVYHIDPLDTNYKVDEHGQVHCAKDKIPMIKLKRKPAKQVPNIGLTNTIILRQIADQLDDDYNHQMFHIADGWIKQKRDYFRYLVAQLTYSIEWQVKNRKLLDITDDLQRGLDAELSLKEINSKI